MEVHIVQRGDTLWKISRQYGVSFDELKRANAHLANPDYIVPGMKIFIPEKKHAVKEGMHKHVKKEIVEKPFTEPIQLPEEEVEEVEMVKPAPMPAPVPTPAPAPIPLPVEELEVPPMPMPMPQPQAQPQPQPQPMVQSQMQVQQSYFQPMISVPCTWMPIFDADCYPYMYSGHMHQAPSYHMPYPMPMQMPEMPLPSPQFPEFEEESPFIPMEAPVELPKAVMPEGWKMIESPELPTMESPTFEMPLKEVCPPEVEAEEMMETEETFEPEEMFEEEMFEPGVVSQMEFEPFAEEMYSEPVSYFPATHFPSYGYECGCHNFAPMIAPSHFRNPCGCNPCHCNPCMSHPHMQSFPYHMMPYSFHGHYGGF